MPTKIKPFSDHKDLLIADCLRERARVLSLRLRTKTEQAPAPASLTLADFDTLIQEEKIRITGGK